MKRTKEIEQLINKIKESGISVAKISSKTGIPPGRIYNWMAPTKNVSPKHEDIQKLQEFFNNPAHIVNEPSAEYLTKNDLPLRDQIAAINAMISVLAGEVAFLRSQHTGEPVASILRLLQKAAEDAVLHG